MYHHAMHQMFCKHFVRSTHTFLRFLSIFEIPSSNNIHFRTLTAILAPKMTHLMRRLSDADVRLHPLDLSCSLALSDWLDSMIRDHNNMILEHLPHSCLV